MTVGLHNWLKHRLVALRRWLRPLTAATVEDLPDRLRENKVYLVGDEGFVWQAAFSCPCGCGESIQLSLLERDRPRWRAHVDQAGRVTLAPSIWRQKGCRSHFFVRNGKIIWA